MKCPSGVGEWEILNTKNESQIRKSEKTIQDDYPINLTGIILIIDE